MCRLIRRHVCRFTGFRGSGTYRYPSVNEDKNRRKLYPACCHTSNLIHHRWYLDYTESGIQMELEVKKGETGWSNKPNPLFKCLHMSGYGLERIVEQSHKGFPLGGNPPEQCQLSATLLFHLLFSCTISESD